MALVVAPMAPNTPGSTFPATMAHGSLSAGRGGGVGPGAIPRAQKEHASAWDQIRGSKAKVRREMAKAAGLFVLVNLANMGYMCVGCNQSFM